MSDIMFYKLKKKKITLIKYNWKFYLSNFPSLSINFLYTHTYKPDISTFLWTFTYIYIYMFVVMLWFHLSAQVCVSCIFIDMKSGHCSHMKICFWSVFLLHQTYSESINGAENVHRCSKRADMRKKMQEYKVYLSCFHFFFFCSTVSSVC